MAEAILYPNTPDPAFVYMLFALRGAQRFSARLTLEIDSVVERPIIVEFVTKPRAESCRSTHQDVRGWKMQPQLWLCSTTLNNGAIK